MYKFITQVKRNWFFILLLIGFFTWIIYSYLSEGIFYLLATSDINAVLSFVNSFGGLAVFMFVLLVILEVVLAPIAPFILYIVGGILFGAFWGGTLVLFGNVIGAIIAFLIARKYGRGLVEKKINLKVREKFDKFTQKYGVWALFFLRLNPFTTSDIFSYMAGLTKMKLRTLIIGTTLGLIPLIYIQTYMGDIFVRDNPIILIVFIAIGWIYFVFFLYGLWFLVLKKSKVRRAKKKESKKSKH